jgi:hypothetical protein
MEAETLDRKMLGIVLMDSLRTTEGDQMNINPKLIELAGLIPANLRFLESVIVHEYVHKTQGMETDEEEDELEAYAAQLTYMDSLGLDTTNAFCRAMWHGYLRIWCDYSSGDSMRLFISPPFTWSRDHCAYLRLDTAGTGPDYFVSFGLDDQNEYQYGLSSMMASDMRIFNDPPQLPVGHSFALICGGVPALDVGRILALDIYQGQVVAPHETIDFGPPTYPPMHLRSMTRCIFSGLYFAIDAAYNAEEERIVAMSDNNQDLLPEAIISTYASSLWRGFEELEGMKGVDVGGYIPSRPFGLFVTHDDVHLPHAMDPYATFLFLPDANFDRVADACETVHAYEFLLFTPCIQVPLPVQGDQTVQLFATWMDNIQIWASDSLGQNLSELLGSVQILNGVDAACALSRPLVEGEFIVPVDQTINRRPSLATRVGSGSAADETIPALPAQFTLFAPFPNPFNATTTLRFDLPRSGMVTLRIYDVLGREAATLISDTQPAGHHSAFWNAAACPSGLYFARLEAEGFAQTQKLLLLK